MGWNCFKSQDSEKSEENEAEKVPIGARISQALQTRFPRLYKLIKRIKEDGAPFKLKQRRRRKVNSVVQVTSRARGRAQQEINNMTEEKAKNQITKSDDVSVNKKSGLKDEEQANHLDENEHSLSCDNVRRIMVQPVNHQGSTRTEQSFPEEEKFLAPPSPRSKCLQIPSLVKNAVAATFEEAVGNNNSDLSNLKLKKTGGILSILDESKAKAVHTTSFDKTNRTAVLQEVIHGSEEVSTCQTSQGPSPISTRLTSSFGSVVSKSLEEEVGSPHDAPASLHIAEKPDNPEKNQDAKPQNNARRILVSPAPYVEIQRASVTPSSGQPSPVTFHVASLVDSVVDRATRELQCDDISMSSGRPSPITFHVASLVDNVVDNAMRELKVDSVSISSGCPSPVTPDVASFVDRADVNCLKDLQGNEVSTSKMIHDEKPTDQHAVQDSISQASNSSKERDDEFYECNLQVVFMEDDDEEDEDEGYFYSEKKTEEQDDVTDLKDETIKEHDDKTIDDNVLNKTDTMVICTDDKLDKNNTKIKMDSPGHARLDRGDTKQTKSTDEDDTYTVSLDRNGKVGCGVDKGDNDSMGGLTAKTDDQDGMNSVKNGAQKSNVNKDKGIIDKNDTNTTWLDSNGKVKGSVDRTDNDRMGGLNAYTYGTDGTNVLKNGVHKSDVSRFKEGNARSTDKNILYPAAQKDDTEENAFARSDSLLHANHVTGRKNAPDEPSSIGDRSELKQGKGKVTDSTRHDEILAPGDEIPERNDAAKLTENKVEAFHGRDTGNDDGSGAIGNEVFVNDDDVNDAACAAAVVKMTAAAEVYRSACFERNAGNQYAPDKASNAVDTDTTNDEVVASASQDMPM